MEVDDLAVRVAEIGRSLATTTHRLGHLAPGARALGGDGPGQLGALGRALSDQCDEALEARGREAVRYGMTTSDLAGTLHQAATGYRDLESRREGGAS